MAKDSVKKQLFGLSEYAKLVGISRQAIHKKIKKNKLPKGVTASMIGGRFIITDKTGKYAKNNTPVEPEQHQQANDQ